MNYVCCLLTFAGALYVTSANIASRADLNAPVTSMSYFRAHSWNVRIKADEVHGPNLDHLLEIPIDINAGVATGDVFVWMDKDDSFPHLRGTVKARDVDFQIWDAPAAFHE